MKIRPTYSSKPPFQVKVRAPLARNLSKDIEWSFNEGISWRGEGKISRVTGRVAAAKHNDKYMLMIGDRFWPDVPEQLCEKMMRAEEAVFRFIKEWPAVGEGNADDAYHSPKAWKKSAAAERFVETSVAPDIAPLIRKILVDKKYSATRCHNGFLGMPRARIVLEPDRQVVFDIIEQTALALWEHVRDENPCQEYLVRE